MKPIAIGYRVVVELDPVEEKSAGGIIMTANVRETDEICMTTGTVSDIGPFAFCGNDGGPGWPAWYKVGDKVIFAEHSGRRWADDATGIKYRIMNDRDVIAKIEE